MSDEPVRWLESDEAPAPLAALLREAKRVPPMPDTVRDAVRASLREPGAPPPRGETAPAGAAAATASKVAPLLAALGAIAVAALGVLALVPPSRDRGPASQPPAVAPAPSTDEAGEVVAPAPPPAPERDESLDGAADASPARHTSRSQGGVFDALAEEHALVQRARAALARDPEGALLAAADHERRFADGQLAAEREFVRIKALVSLGRRDEAAARGKRFLARFAASPYADRVRTLTRDGGAL